MSKTNTSETSNSSYYKNENKLNKQALEEASQVIDVLDMEVDKLKTENIGLKYVVNEQSNHIDLLNGNIEKYKTELHAGSQSSQKTSTTLIKVLEKIGKPYSDDKVKQIQNDFRKKYLSNLK
jgi:FtsZ-binding cell division protein ZapB